MVLVFVVPRTDFVIHLPLLLEGELLGHGRVLGELRVFVVEVLLSRHRALLVEHILLVSVFAGTVLVLPVQLLALRRELPPVLLHLLVELLLLLRVLIERHGLEVAVRGPGLRGLASGLGGAPLAPREVAPRPGGGGPPRLRGALHPVEGVGRLLEPLRVRADHLLPAPVELLSVGLVAGTHRVLVLLSLGLERLRAVELHLVVVERLGEVLLTVGALPAGVLPLLPTVAPPGLLPHIFQLVVDPPIPRARGPLAVESGPVFLELPLEISGRGLRRRRRGPARSRCRTRVSADQGSPRTCFGVRSSLDYSGSWRTWGSSSPAFAGCCKSSVRPLS